MLFIYSNTRIEGKKGNYGNPIFFDKVNREATEVLTDDKLISEAYVNAGVKVNPLIKKRRRKGVENGNS